MKERPILFSTPMVRAILAGTKTQTRRVFKLPSKCSWYEGLGGEAKGWIEDDEGPAWWHIDEQRCFYVDPGDQLWVREAWRVIDVADCFAPREITAAHRIWFETDGPHEPPAGRYRPGMFMPRWASRITLEVTGVRVERLQDINRSDAIAEGVQWNECPTHQTLANMEAQRIGDSMGMATHYTAEIDYVGGYRRLWESINGPDSWDKNPWVWAITFQKIES